MTRIALTGGTGFVGKILIDRALEGDHAVRALARSAQPARQGVEWVQGDLADTGALARLVDGAEAVIHVAGVVNAPDWTGFEAGNIAGTGAVIAAATKAGVRRFVHVSSLAAREPELSLYGKSKAGAEEAVRASSLDWTIIRPPAVYGPGDADMLDLFKAASRGVVPVPPPGRLSIIHVDDLARLLLALVPAGADVSHQLFEADDGKDGAWTHKSFARALGWAFDRRVTALSMPATLMRLAARTDRLARRDRARLTLDRVRYILHKDWTIDPKRRPPTERWMPRIRSQQGLRATARWYREQGWLR